MAPRSGKRRQRMRNPIQFWLPVAHPCLRNVNMPEPYYMPIPPEMYLPPFALPPTFFTKPFCHCKTDDFCSASNYRNSSECLKMHPIFCPYGTRCDQTSNLQGNNVNENINNTDEQNTSDNNECSTCALPDCNRRNNRKRSELQQLHESVPSYINSEFQQCCNKQDCMSQIKHTYSNSEKHDPSEIDHDTKETRESPDQERLGKQFNRSVDSSCQIQLSNSSIGKNNRNARLNKLNCGLTNRNKCSTGSSTSYAADSDNSYETNLETISEIQRVGPKNLTTNNKPESTHARNDRAHKKSGCCLVGSEEKSKIKAIERDSNKRKKEIKLKSPKFAECGCSSTNIRKKTSYKSQKISNCDCSSTQIIIKPSKGSGNVSECKCSTYKVRKKSSEINSKTSECGPSSKISLKSSSKSRMILEKESSCCKVPVENYSSNKLLTTKSNKKIKGKSIVTNERQSNCYCKFPPAYEHLSCTGNLDNCSCNKSQ